MAAIEVYVDKKVGGFSERIKIDWLDGATTEITDKIVLHGKDGKVYRVPTGSEHGIICRKILKENGYSTK
jgi:hypothetical protein